MKPATIIRKHYGIKRQLTEKEVAEEIENLKRRKAKGSLDDSDAILVAKLKL